MIDFKACCNALAARFAPGTISTPSGAVAMRHAYGQMPKNVAAVPCVLVEPINGTIQANPGQWSHEMDVDVLFLLSKRPGDPARVELQRQIWLPTLLAATEGQLKLGIGVQTGWELAKAIPIGWEWTEYPIGAENYDAIRIHYRLFVFETVSLVP
jgi:hypothetical protein